jgi:hypothetical protein
VKFVLHTDALESRRSNFGPRERKNNKQEGQFVCNLTQGAWKSNKYYALVCVCMLARACVRACMWVPERVDVCMRIRACNLANPACKAYALYCDVI